MRAAATAPVGGDFARKGGVPGIKGWDAGGRDAEVDFEAWERGNGQWVDGKGGGKGGGGGIYIATSNLVCSPLGKLLVGIW